MRLFRVSCLLSLIAISLALFLTSLFYSTVITKEQITKTATTVRSSIHKYIPKYIFKTSQAQRDSVPLFDYSTTPRRHRYAITSSVQTSAYTYIAMTLGYSINRHNDLDALNTEMVLLVRTEGEDALSPQNITNLQKVGWKTKVVSDLEFDGVNTTDIRAWHRHNFNKLHLWTWTQYEKVIFIDADIICKGSISDLFKMPGDLAASSDVWWNAITDTRFNSGVLMLRPNMEEFRILSKAVSDPQMHEPWEADQAFLNNFYRYRFYGLPYKFNFNLVILENFPNEWNMLWEEAVLVHMTVQKPQTDPLNWCLWEKGCVNWEMIEYYFQIYKEMIDFYNLKDFPVIH